LIDGEFRSFAQSGAHRSIVGEPRDLTCGLRRDGALEPCQQQVLPRRPPL